MIFMGKPENVENQVESEINLDLKNDENLLEIANEVFEKKIPIELWNENDDKKEGFTPIELLFQYIDKESEHVINVLLMKNKKPIPYQINIAPSSLNTQFEKFKPEENDVFRIKFLGIKKNTSEFGNKMDYKAFVVKKFDKTTKTFITTKKI